MKAIINNTGKEKTNGSEKNDLSSIPAEGTFMRVPLDQIDISPLNYRKRFDQQDLERSKDIALHGILQNLTLRKMPTGRFELVIGERRYRAAQIAGTKTVPAMIEPLTDEQVIEIMLVENLQRENPHPLHEAQGIERMYNAGKPIDDICARLGKSKSYIYSRLKWVELIVPLQDVFLADKLTIVDITELSFLSADTQQEFFDEYCKDWEKKNFRIIDLRHAVSRFKYDLAKAPFDIKDKTLIPNAGLCGKCPFNSATIKSLFPEMAKEAVCTNKGCYNSKCIASLQKNILAAVTAFQPDALLTYGTLSEERRMVIDSMPELNALPEHSYYDVSIYRLPDEPDEEDYLDYEENEDGELEDESFAIAKQEYEAEMAEYESRIASGKLQKAILIGHKDIDYLYFSTEKRTYTSSVKTVTAKEVQEAIKDGSVTPELITAEISRIKDREKRAKELDREKVQLQVYTKFNEYSKDEMGLNPADLVAARLLVYHSADYQARYVIQETLFAGITDYSSDTFYNALANLTDKQYAFMIRTALTSKPESKLPTHISGMTFYKMADCAGVDVDVIEKQQEKKAKDREAKANARITILEGKAGSLFSAA